MFKCLNKDQFDNLEKHTQWGIDILEKYIKFVKERTEIELSYAKQLRYTACKAFLSTLNEMNDYAGQHEVISENMTSNITVELARYVQELKQERKSRTCDRSVLFIKALSPLWFCHLQNH
ncbi:hypothetical protein GH733_011160 [Mirounga leonina]|nr:hypothetical protein GH733_011160 [Mirounga leonina]